MIIGTFWCQRDSKWVRFVQEAGMVHAESASARKDDPSLAMAWQPEADGVWPVDYSLGDGEALTSEIYCVKSGVLYHDTGIVNRYTQSNQINHLSSEGKWFTYTPRMMSEKGNPFPIVQAGNRVVLLPYKQLPLTIELQKAKRDEEILQEERLTEELLKAERLAEQERQAKWAEIQEGDFFLKFINAVASDFLPWQRSYLFNDLTKEVPIDFTPLNYQTPSDFVDILSMVLIDDSNQFYQGIIRAAAVTHTDRELELNPSNSEAVRKDLFEKKKAFYFAVYNAGIKYIQDTFNPPESVEQPLLVQEKNTIGPIYTFFSGLLATIARFIPNMFHWSKPAVREDIPRVNNDVSLGAVDHRAPVNNDKQHDESGLGIVGVIIGSSQESWLLRRKAGELVQSSVGYVNSFRSLFWSSAQPTGDATKNAAKPDDEVRLENRL